MAELCQELAPLVKNARVRDVQALPPRDALLVLAPDPDRVPNRDVIRLRLSADPDAARMHLQHGRVLRHDGPVDPFYTRLQKELSEARIHALEQVAGDRAAIVEFRETSVGERRALIVELFGRRPNFVLVDRDDRVLATLVPPPRSKAASPRLALGEPWKPPGGLRPGTADEPSLREAFPPGDDEPPTLAPLSWHVGRAFEATVDSNRREEAQKRLLSRAERKLKKARRLVTGLEARASASDTAERVRQDGELLKSHLHLVQRGLTSVEVPDFFEDGEPRTIELDPKLSPHENVERRFARYKKLVRAREAVAGELAAAQERVDALEELCTRARDESLDADGLDALDAAGVERGLLDPRQIADPRKKKAPAPRLPYRSFHSKRGTEIRVGRNARDNDQLTFRHAHGNDVWLHTAESPGSHVILKVPPRAEPDDEDLLDAAHLAVHFSPQRDARRCPVHIARRKEVHKPRGAKPGLVTLSGGRILQVRAQPERLERLLRPQKGGAGSHDG